MPAGPSKRRKEKRTAQLMQVSRYRDCFNVMAFRSSGNGDAISNMKVAKFDVLLGNLHDGVFRNEYFVFLGLIRSVSAACPTAGKTDATWKTNTACIPTSTTTAAPAAPSTSASTAAPTGSPSRTLARLCVLRLDDVLDLQALFLGINLEDFCDTHDLRFAGALVRTALRMGGSGKTN